MEQSTQTRHPWRATVRTIAAALVALLVIAPQIILEAGLHETAYGAQALAVIGAVTRVLALPSVDGWLRRWAPWLAAEPPQDR